MAGRKPKPTNLKVLHGNPGGRKLPRREPKPKAGIPKPPAWIEAGSEAMRVWDEFAAELDAMQVLTLADRAALAALVAAYCDWREACGEGEREGLTYASIGAGGGYLIRPQPAVAIRSDSWKRYKSMLSEFGLTPSARTRISANPNQSASPLEKFLESG